ncbi:hypothetical protein JOL62DRAFT_567964 [Phyllosticta paracitricarpa]|uniref:Uncharacterized protein n=1 Tax=Phyllosticta paracitricarpa TaxID=2016321 RepID=A0ABR1NH42_9PEZI
MVSRAFLSSCVHTVLLCSLLDFSSPGCGLQFCSSAAIPFKRLTLCSPATPLPAILPVKRPSHRASHPLSVPPAPPEVLLAARQVPSPSSPPPSPRFPTQIPSRRANSTAFCIAFATQRLSKFEISIHLLSLRQLTWLRSSSSIIGSEMLEASPRSSVPSSPPFLLVFVSLAVALVLPCSWLRERQRGGCTAKKVKGLDQVG